MNHPGRLRHSKTHLAAIDRERGRHWVRFELRLPGDDPRFTRGDIIGGMVKLPDGARVHNAGRDRQSDRYILLVDIRGNERLVIDKNVQVRRLGPIDPPPPRLSTMEILTGPRYFARRP